ncbi:MAG: MFS transporter [Alphaproteobacteria bacterium]
MATAPQATAGDGRAAPGARGRRVLRVCGGAHALHDGYTDLLGILLPLLRDQFALGYTAIGALRTLYACGMAGGQIPAGLLAERIGGRWLLAGGTALAALGYLFAGLGGGLAAAAIGVALSGIGSSTQHPIASSLVAAAHEGAASRPALGSYNFAGDVGKVVVPALFAFLAAAWDWRAGLVAIAVVGLVAALALPGLVPASVDASLRPAARTADPGAELPRGPFRLLLAIGVTDSAVRAGFLTFLPFLLSAKGADLATLGVALALLFAGGAAGKFACGHLGQRFGVLATVSTTESLTAALIVASLALPLGPLLALLPLLGLALNGTSSVLYGTVPELVPEDRRARAFAVFYTGGSVASGAGPLLGGAIGDAVGLGPMTALLAAASLATIPLAIALRPSLAR